MKEPNVNEAGAPVLDVSVLSELTDSVGGDREFVVELIRTFLADATEQLEAIDVAAAAGDAEALVRPAHTLKSSSATLGATRLAATSRAVEMAARSGSIDSSVADDVRALHTDLDAAASALLRWTDDEGGQ
jgi:two-component system, sensor histidine kinase